MSAMWRAEGGREALQAEGSNDDDGEASGLYNIGIEIQMGTITK
jgi:hypothetical protein